MKNITKLALGIFIFLPQLGFSQSGKICNWKDDKKGAVVLTFDDWSPGHYPVVVPELNSRSLKATFFITMTSVAPWNHDWPDVNTTANAGHEIGNHTATHPDLTTKSASVLHTEISAVKDTIQKHVTTQKVVSFAYPLGAGAGTTAKDIEVRDTLKASGHIASRSVNPATGQYYSYNFAPAEEDYYKIRAFGMSGSVSTKAFTDETQKAINAGGMMVYLYHSVDDAANSHGDTWFNKVLKDSLQKQLNALVYLQDQIWITTFGQAVKYHKEKNCATLSEISAPTGSQWIVNLTDTLQNNTVYNQPLTLKLKMNGISYDKIIQNGNNLAYTIVGDTIIFNAVPDAGQITLSSANQAPTLDALANMSIDQMDGIQTVNLSGITAGAAETQNLTVTAIALNTTLIKNLTVNYASPDATGSISFSPDPAYAGTTTIVVRVTDGGTPVKYTERSFTVVVAGITTSAKESVFSDKDLIISPNPASDLLTISSEKQLTSPTISIEDLSGAIVYEGFFSSAEKMEINLSGKRSGVYLLRVKSDQGMIVRKLIVL